MAADNPGGGGLGVGAARPGTVPAARVAAIVVFVLAGWLVVIAALFAIRPFSMPASSMAPGLLVGDYFLVSKASYGVSRLTLPWNDIVPWPLQGRFWPADPKRGDVVVFKLPKDRRTDYVKRVVGLPGDRIQVLKGVLTINGEPVKRERIADYEMRDRLGQPARVPRYIETLPDGTRYPIIEAEGDDGFMDNTAVYTVPPGHFFAMGDNRDNSADSRLLDNVGYVPLDNLVGRAWMRYFSIDEAGSIRSDRLFTTID